MTLILIFDVLDVECFSLLRVLSVRSLKDHFPVHIDALRTSVERVVRSTEAVAP